MLDPLLIAAIVEVLFLLVQQFFPGLPISKELVHAIVLALLGWFAYKAAVRPAIARLAPKAEERGLIGRE